MFGSGRTAGPTPDRERAFRRFPPRYAILREAMAQYAGRRRASRDRAAATLLQQEFPPAGCGSTSPRRWGRALRQAQRCDAGQERPQTLGSSVVRATNQERERIGEGPDDLGQVLTAATLQVGAIPAHARPLATSPEEQRTEIEDHRAQPPTCAFRLPQPRTATSRRCRRRRSWRCCASWGATSPTDGIARCAARAAARHADDCAGALPHRAPREALQLQVDAERLVLAIGDDGIGQSRNRRDRRGTTSMRSRRRIGSIITLGAGPARWHASPCSTRGPGRDSGAIAAPRGERCVA